MKKFYIALFLLINIKLVSQNIHIIPEPVRIERGKNYCRLMEHINFQWQNEKFNKNEVNLNTSLFKKILWDNNQIANIKIDQNAQNKEQTKIIISLPDSTYTEGYYKLVIENQEIKIYSVNSGILYAFETLSQLISIDNNGQYNIPNCTVVDYPRLVYRGMHLDCSRHFFSVDFIKKYIDYLTYFKFNTFHWHLTDDQGWRIEIKKYPNLTNKGAWRNGTIVGHFPGTANTKKREGGFYTQNQIKEIVKYASERYVTIIPEIEMPGHSSAAIAAYPYLSCFSSEPTFNYFPNQSIWYGNKAGKQVQQTWGVFKDVFCAGNDSTFSFIENVLSEVITLFPSTYIHIGGDECPKENWIKCSLCQQRIKKMRLKNEHELQSYFINRIEKFLNSKGKKIIGWDEILEGGLAPNATVMSWRGEEGGITAAKENHQVIMTPGGWCYFDHSQSENEDSVTIGGYTPLEKVYNYEPIPSQISIEKEKYLLGAQANVWTEYMEYPSKIQYMIFPRIAALSEVLWSKKENKNWKYFEQKLPFQFQQYEKWKVSYSEAYYDFKTIITPAIDNGINYSIHSNYKNGYFLGLFNPEKEQAVITNKPVLFNDTVIHINQSGEYISILYNSPDLATSQMINFIKQPFHFSKSTGKKITLVSEPSKSYPGDGSFTLVNGVINDKGFVKSNEFLGYNGGDCELIIDLGKLDSFSNIKVYYLDQTLSWIWPPKGVDIFISNDEINFTKIESKSSIEKNGESGSYFLQNIFNKTKCRFVKLKIKNYSKIPDGNPGAANKAWLFLSEIEISE